MKKYISINKVKNNSFQPIINYSKDEIEKCINDILSDNYFILLKNIDDYFEVVIGEKYIEAIKKLNRFEFYGEVLDVIDIDSSKYNKNLNPIEEAILYSYIMSDTGITQKELAEYVGITQSTIANKLRLLKLNQVVQDGIVNGLISERHGRTLLSLDLDVQEGAYKYILDNNLNVKNSEEYVYTLLKRKKDGKKYLTKGFTRNIKVALNTIEQCISMIRKLGIDVDDELIEDKDKVIISITLKK